jgi:hypothetical protein
MNAQQNIGQYLIESFKKVSDCAVFRDYPIKIASPANEPVGQANDGSIFRTTDK